VNTTLTLVYAPGVPSSKRTTTPAYPAAAACLPVHYALDVPTADVLRRANGRWNDCRAYPDAWDSHSSGQWKGAHPLAVALADYDVEVARNGTYCCPLPRHGCGDQRPGLSVDIDGGCGSAAGRSAFDFLRAAEDLMTPGEAVAYLGGWGKIPEVTVVGTGVERGDDWRGRS